MIINYKKLIALILISVLLQSCTAMFKKGDTLYKNGNYSDAVNVLKEYVSSNPRDAIGHYTLADSLYFKYSTDYQKNKSNINDLNLSNLHFSKAIDLNTNYAEAYSQRGVVRLVLGDIQGAKRDYEKAIAIKPMLDRVYFNRGYWFEEQGHFSEAISDYEKYISLSKNNYWRDDAIRRIETLQLKIKLKKHNN